MTYYSQAGQDEWVHSIIGDSGFFVDVGAHDGIVHSNTYALEQAGWRGICIEPNREVFSQLVENRHCVTVNTAASAVVGVIPFDGVRVGSGAEMACSTLTFTLEISGETGTIDYLSIDTEGHDLQVLEGMDFTRWPVRLITIETNLYLNGAAHKDAIYAYLTELGFDRVFEDVVAPGYGPYEDWYEAGA